MKTSRPDRAAAKLETGNVVRITKAVEKDIYDVSKYINRIGRITGSADGVMFEVQLSNGNMDSFFPEELQLITETLDQLTTQALSIAKSAV